MAEQRRPGKRWHGPIELTDLGPEEFVPTVVERNQRRDRIGDRDDWICGICQWPVDRFLVWRNLTDVPLRKPGRDPRYAHGDHVLPRSQGGVNTDANLQLTHQYCNLHKHGGDSYAVEQARANLSQRL